MLRRRGTWSTCHMIRVRTGSEHAYALSGSLEWFHGHEVARQGLSWACSRRRSVVQIDGGRQDCGRLRGRHKRHANRA